MLQYKIKGLKKLQTAVICVLMFLCVPLFVTPWIAAHQAPLSMGFSRQEYRSGFPFPPPGNLPDPGIEPTSHMSPALAGEFFTTEPPGKPQAVHIVLFISGWHLAVDKEKQGSGHFGHQASLESWVRFEGTFNKWRMSQMCQVWEKLLFCIVVDFLFSPIIFGYDFIDCACITGKLVIKF